MPPAVVANNHVAESTSKEVLATSSTPLSSSGSFHCRLLPLHRHPNLAEACAKVLNEEWPRSIGARLHQVERSYDDGPTSLVLVRQENSNLASAPTPEAVVGYSKLSSVAGLEEAALVESVVISRSLRGRGLGRLLMTETHDFARRRGFTVVYLSTHDKQAFYERLGYSFCTPVCGRGASHVVNTAIQSIYEGKSRLGVALEEDEKSPSSTSIDPTSSKNVITGSSAFVESSTSDPPPPPPSPSVTTTPAPPPPPPPGRFGKAASKAPTLVPNERESRVVRMDPRSISWMSLDLIRNPFS